MQINLTINGKAFAVDLGTLPAPDVTLNTFIREHAALTGTKFMCLEGGCGACVVVVKGRHPVTQEFQTWAVNSCLTLLNTCDSLEITTIEGLGNKKDGYHPLQKRLAHMNGTQCGYCSPGILMNMYGLLESKMGKVTMEEVENAFGGNICRCTGYRPILDTLKSFAIDSDISTFCCPDIEDLTARCPKTGQSCSGSCKGARAMEAVTSPDGGQWFWPNTLEDVFKAFESIEAKPYMLVAGNTAHGVYRRADEIKTFVAVNKVSELRSHSLDSTALTLGANMSLSETMELFLTAAKQPGFEYCQKLYNHFDLIANVPVRNSGTLAGNLMTKHAHKDFPSDVYITLNALDAVIVVMSDKSTKKSLTMEEFLATDMKKKVLFAIILKPYPTSEYFFNSYKIMPRAQNAHAYVNAAFIIKIDKASGSVADARLCFGGITPEFTHARQTEESLKTKTLFTKATISEVFKKLNDEIKPDWVLPDADPTYRRTLACGLFYKFLLSIAPADLVKPEFRSGADILKREVSSGKQTFETKEKNYPLNQPVPKLEAQVQTSGEAKYVNDYPNLPNQVWCAFVHATVVNCEIESIDAADALIMPGVVAFYSAKDIPGTNTFVKKTLDFIDDEEIFCSGMVKFHSQPVGVIVAESNALANAAAKKVKVVYSKPQGGKLYPSMKEVLEANLTERIKHISELKHGEYKPSVDGKTIKGRFDIGGQYHFTMEPQTTVCVPIEDGMQVYAATQWMDLTQAAIADMLKMKTNEIQVEVRRLGGAYGSKISRGNMSACACALACKLLNRPARFVQTIESMMGALGKRYALHSDYEVQVNEKGKILGLKNNFYEDCGHSPNENPVNFHSTLTARNCYVKGSNWKIDGHIVITDAPSHTWCRAPGTVEGISMMENIIDHIASETGMDPIEVRLANIDKNNKIKELLPTFLQSIDYRKREKEVADFNAKNRWRKRGLGISVMEYPLVYFGMYPASVAVYHNDGTVVISHGGIEMGQGMNTKVAQVAAYTFGIPLGLVKVEPSNSFHGANSMVTGGAVGSESLSMAVRKACNILLDRLKPIRKSLKNPTWQELVAAAYGKYVNMVVNDSYKVGDLEPYTIWGLCCNEVEIDVLTGNVQIKRVDILEDTGESLSPLIDIGQIEGAYVMGLGYWLTEQLTFDQQTGELLTNRTWNYKVPGAKDIPIDFRIDLLQKNPNTKGLLRSKATGEPAVCLSIGVVFAIRRAMEAARKDAGVTEKWVAMGAPTTPETILVNSGVAPEMFGLA